ncbi:hypothetical protein FS815_23865 [Agrobacterium vitis]|uniref:hypothetical protein n=1 Tax=Allorhizobium ampelinum TaxID=3025782 RepID=UPI001F171C50|nr:hypothetical protein [Allorhizobium ampelinum]MCF1449829.1 hypothetical protein [Allorhizobium ampelinum]
MITFTREQLYELVWAKPMRNIAADYGVNAIELAKKCDEHDIPRPKAGYWQKLEHGKPTERASLEKDISADYDLIKMRRLAVLVAPTPDA